MFTLIDSKSASWNLVLFALLELVLVGWLYGAREFMSNIHEMGMLKADDSSSKFKKTAVLVLKWYWIICWQFITPLLLTVILTVTTNSTTTVTEMLYLWPSLTVEHLYLQDLLSFHLSASWPKNLASLLKRL